jgi:hypothetical protein
MAPFLFHPKSSKSHIIKYDKVSHPTKEWSGHRSIY